MEHKCPQCGLDLDWNVPVCPLCQRPLEKWEQARGLAMEKARVRESRRRPLQLVGFVAVVIVGGAVFHRWLPGLESRMIRPQETLPSVPPVPQLSPAPPAPPIDPYPAPELVSTPAEPARAVQRSGAPPPEPEVRVPEGYWLLRARLYDLKTLAPLAGARIEFWHEDKRGAEVRTDAWGRFGALLPRVESGGIEALLAHPGYVRKLLHEPDIPYRELSPRQRAAMAESAAAGDLATGLLREPPGEDILRLDVFAAALP